MKFPVYSPKHYRAPKVGLADAYIGLIAREEQDHVEEIRSLPKGNIRRASMIIGRACLLAQDRWPVAQSALRGIQEELRQHKDPRDTASNPHWRRQTLTVTAQLLEGKDDPKRVKGARSHMHSLASNRMHATLDWFGHVGTSPNNLSRAQRAAFEAKVGERVELRMLLAMTRYNHPWLLALPALPHHDRQITNKYGYANTNYDVALIESGRHTAEPLLHRAQLKGECFGLCAQASDLRRIQMAQRAFIATRDEYASDITLLSGCCDFQMNASGQRFGVLDGRLFKEQTGRISQEDVFALDAVTNHVMLLATANDPSRQGSYDNPSHTPLYTSG